MAKYNEKYMLKAISIAEKAKGKTYPNPNVGAIIVKNGKIIGEGFTQKAGGNHAEIQALEMAGKNAKDATLYVTLEPCCHFGKTPPCTNAIIKAGIKTVFGGINDPNPKVNGAGFQQLKNAGINVLSGFYEDVVKEQLKGFLIRIKKNRPYIFAKIASSIDGKIATNFHESKWITDDVSREKVHLLRMQSDAVLTGIGTVLADDCTLNVRLQNFERNPVRIILDPMLKMPLKSNIMKTSNDIETHILTNAKNENKIVEIENHNVKIHNLPIQQDGMFSKETIEAFLFKMDFTTVMIEAGEKLFSDFLQKKLIDDVIFFVAPKILGGNFSFFQDKIFMKDAQNLTFESVEMLKNDIMIKAVVNGNHR